jgi:hypothetical protein
MKYILQYWDSKAGSGVVTPSSYEAENFGELHSLLPLLKARYVKY